jgi:hypothetical protein
VPEAIGGQHVGTAVRADELADGEHEKEPAERVIPLAPGRRKPHGGAGNPDHCRYQAKKT